MPWRVHFVLAAPLVALEAASSAAVVHEGTPGDTDGLVEQGSVAVLVSELMERAFPPLC